MDRTLLCIDPDPATRLLLRKVLASEGFLVLEAKTAIEGQRSAAHLRPDLILVDVDLVKAAELVPALRQSPGLEEVRLLASTAHAWPEHTQKMLAWGFDRVLLEPLDIDALALELRSCLHATPAAKRLMASPAPPEVLPTSEAPERVVDRDSIESEARATATKSGVGVAPQVEAASLIEVAPPVEAASLIEVAPPVEAASLIEVAPPVEAASLIEVAPSVEAASLVEVAPHVEAASLVEVEAPHVEAASLVEVEAPHEEAAHEQAHHEERAHEEVAHTPTDGVPLDTVAPVVVLEPVEVPPLWRLSLTPLTASLVRSIAATEWLLAVFDDEEVALVIVAATSGRHVVNGVPVDVGAPIGTRVLASSVPWLHPAIRKREAGVVATVDVGPSPLVLRGSSTLVIVPVASPDHVYGVVILGDHRGSKVPSFGAGKMARSVADARHIAGLVETLREMDRATAERRRELEQVRLETVRTLLPELMGGAKRSRKHGAARERPQSGDGREAADRDRIIGLGVTLGERLGLSARRQEALRQALEVWDIGRTWVEDVLLTGARLSVAGRARLLDTHAEHAALILSALDWPPAVVELVRVHQAPWNGEGQPAGPSGADIPVEARVLAVVSAFVTLTAGRAGEEEAIREALVELSRQAGNRLDPDVVEALIRLGPTSEDPHSGKDDHGQARN